MALSKNDISIAILSGGKSSRMGRDKALAEIDGTPMLQRVLNTAKPICGHIFLVSDHEAHRRFGVEMIPDAVKGIGPAGGILSALRHCRTPLLLVLGCDMPYLNTKGLSFILKTLTEKQNCEVCIPYVQLRPEPLVCAIRKTALPQWEKSVISGERKLENIIVSLPCCICDGDDTTVFNNGFFTNINTPEELRNTTKH